MSCWGPSGSNVEYVVRLAEAMRRLAPGHSDPHLFGVEERVLRRARAAHDPDPVLKELNLI